MQKKTICSSALFRASSTLLVFLACRSNPRLLWFYFTSPFDWSRNLAPSSQPKTICSSALSCALSTALVFLFESSLVNDDVTFALTGRSDYFCFGLRRSVENNSNVVTSNFIKEVRKVNISGNLTICAMQKAEFYKAVFFCYEKKVIVISLLSKVDHYKFQQWLAVLMWLERF